MTTNEGVRKSSGKHKQRHRLRLRAETARTVTLSEIRKLKASAEEASDNLAIAKRRLLFWQNEDPIVVGQSEHEWGLREAEERVEEDDTAYQVAKEDLKHATQKLREATWICQSLGVRI